MGNKEKEVEEEEIYKGLVGNKKEEEKEVEQPVREVAGMVVVCNATITLLVMV